MSADWCSLFNKQTNNVALRAGGAGATGATKYLPTKLSIQRERKKKFEQNFLRRQSADPD
jgi:hypothetical protein